MKDRIFLGGVILTLSFLAGCGGTASPAKTSSSGPSSSTGSAFKNPIYPHNFADPFVLKVGKTYYAYATNVDIYDIPTLHSTDLVHWTGLKDSMPSPPRWAVSDIWAPNVFRLESGKYILYFAGHDAQAGHQCIGYAMSSSPAGPFINRAQTKPFICQSALGGDIDPFAFRDANGTPYLLWKNDGNCCGVTAWIWSQRLSADGTKLLGKPAKLNQNDDPWEGAVIEMPSLYKHANAYYLFFAANDYASYNYSVGYAVCKTPMGPCKDAVENPILTSKCSAAGPGGKAVVTDARGQSWFIYHAWLGANVGDNSVGRFLWMDKLDWKNGKPAIEGPMCKTEPGPAT